jgi:hypothetical protein
MSTFNVIKQSKVVKHLVLGRNKTPSSNYKRTLKSFQKSHVVHTKSMPFHSQILPWIEVQRQEITSILWFVTRPKWFYFLLFFLKNLIIAICFVFIFKNYFTLKCSMTILWIILPSYRLNHIRLNSQRNWKFQIHT